MIKRSRLYHSNEPAILTSVKAREEYNKVKEYYEAYGNTPSHLFKVYREDDVKNELNKLFHYKCAYCETHYKTTADLNIEHYRPKSEVKVEENGKMFTGYWWLATKWSNLLPACKKCNNVYVYTYDGEEQRLGKGNFFPISNIAYQNRCAPLVNDERIEEPLLINPAEENPRDYIEFKYKKNLSIVSSISNILKGKKSIQNYALNRPELVKARTNEIKKFAHALIDIDESIYDLSTATTFTGRRKYLVRIKRKFSSLLDIYLKIEEHSYIQAKLTYLINWLQKIPERRVHQILYLLDIE